MSRLVTCIFLFFTVQTCFGQQMKLSPEQQHVWRMEEKYWQVVQAHDREGYIALWDEDFVGWPDNCTAPIRKPVIRSETFGTLRGMTNFHLEPKAVQVFQDVAITFYVVTAAHTPKEGNHEEVTFRITHTWRKVNEVWLIIGGMSSPDHQTKQNMERARRPLAR